MGIKDDLVEIASFHFMKADALLEVTKEVLNALASHLEENEPYAINDINALRSAVTAIPSSIEGLDL